MDSNIIKIVSKPKTDTVNHDLVEMLEGLLDRVKAGEVVALSYAAVTTDSIGGSIGWNWGGDDSRDFALLGLTTIMANRFASEFE